MLNYKVTTQPTVEPIPLADAKKHLRVLGSGDDGYITDLITSAREYAESYHAKAYANKTITAVAGDLEGIFKLPVSPIINLTSVTYEDIDGDVHDVTDKYEVDNFSYPSRLLLKEAIRPEKELKAFNAVTIVYTAGETPSMKTKQAMLLLIGHWYENREEVIAGTSASTVPFAADALLQQERHPYL